MAAERVVAGAAATRDSQGPGGAGDSAARAWSIVGSSSLVRVLDGMVLVATAAWRGSVSSAMLRRLTDQLKARSPIERIRLTSGVTSVASATVLAIQRLGSRPAPLTWVVPAITRALSRMISGTLPAHLSDTMKRLASLTFGRKIASSKS